MISVFLQVFILLFVVHANNKGQCFAQFFLPDNPYDASPFPTQQRSPCPAINSLANHGYISRNGTHIPITSIATALERVFGVNTTQLLPMLEPSIVLGVPSAGFSSDDDITPMINMKDMYEHNAIEHDASIVRQDDFFEPLGQFDSTLFERLIDNSKNSNNDHKNENGNSGGGWISTQDLLDYQRERILHSRKNNPEHSFNHHDGFVQSIIGSEKLLFLLLGGDPNLERMDANYLESFLKEGKIPDNFVPRIDMGLDAIHFSESPYSEMLLNFSLRITAAVEYEPLLEEEEEASSITTNLPSPSMAPSTAIPTNNVDGTSSAGVLFPVMKFRDIVVILCSFVVVIFSITVY